MEIRKASAARLTFAGGGYALAALLLLPYSSFHAPGP